MSESIAIPRRQRGGISASFESPSGSSSASSSMSFPSLHYHASPSSSASAGSVSSSPRTPRAGGERRPSLLSSSISKQEHIVVNVGHPNGPPRLITCVRSSQGFDWNQEIFLPPYADHDTADLERKPDPVHEIVLTEADIKAVYPE